MKSDSSHYVYVYFDPRNYEMLYVGKGRGGRKYAHLPDKKGSAMERRIHEIEQAGLEPLVKVVAANMTVEVQLMPVMSSIQGATWNYTAAGAGFSQMEAESNAKDRLIKQITNDTTMSLSN